MSTPREILGSNCRQRAATRRRMRLRCTAPPSFRLADTAIRFSGAGCGKVCRTIAGSAHERPCSKSRRKSLRFRRRYWRRSILKAFRVRRSALGHRIRMPNPERLTPRRQTERRFRPFSRRAAMTFRPSAVRIRRRNPWTRFRRRLCGWNVRFMPSASWQRRIIAHARKRHNGLGRRRRWALGVRPWRGGGRWSAGIARQTASRRRIPGKPPVQSPSPPRTPALRPAGSGAGV